MLIYSKKNAATNLMAMERHFFKIGHTKQTDDILNCIFLDQFLYLIHIHWTFFMGPINNKSILEHIVVQCRTDKKP